MHHFVGGVLPRGCRCACFRFRLRYLASWLGLRLGGGSEDCSREVDTGGRGDSEPLKAGSGGALGAAGWPTAVGAKGPGVSLGLSPRGCTEAGAKPQAPLRSSRCIRPASESRPRPRCLQSLCGPAGGGRGAQPAGVRGWALLLAAWRKPHSLPPTPSRRVPVMAPSEAVALAGHVLGACSTHSGPHPAHSREAGRSPTRQTGTPCVWDTKPGQQSQHCHPEPKNSRCSFS